MYRQKRHELLTPLNHIIGYAEMLIEDAATNGTDPLHIEEFMTVQELGVQLLETVNELFQGHKYDTALVDIKKVDLLFIIPIQIYILCETLARLSGIDGQTKDIKTIQSAIGRFLSLVSDSMMTQSFKGGSIGDSTLSLVETYLSRINTSAVSNCVAPQAGRRHYMQFVVISESD